MAVLDTLNCSECTRFSRDSSTTPATSGVEYDFFDGFINKKKERKDIGQKAKECSRRSDYERLPLQFRYGGEEKEKREKKERRFFSS
jgi:hypothetical protein